MKKIVNDWQLVFIACLTIGLAPFTPEPHVWGKLKWVMGGAIGMQPMDWLDLAMHGTPFVLALRLVVLKFKNVARLKRYGKFL